MVNELEECKLSQRKAIWELVRLYDEAQPDMPKGEVDKRVAEKVGLSHRTVAIYRQEMSKLLNTKNSNESLQFTTAGRDKDHVLAQVPAEKRLAVIAEAKKEGGRVTAKKLEKAAVKVGAKKPRQPKENPYQDVERHGSEEFKPTHQETMEYGWILTAAEQIERYAHDIELKFKHLSEKEKVEARTVLKSAGRSITNLLKRLEGKV
jgi:hypothetical protein